MIRYSSNTKGATSISFSATSMRYAHECNTKLRSQNRLVGVSITQVANDQSPKGEKVKLFYVP